jgi:hypothetical protein
MARNGRGGAPALALAPFVIGAVLLMSATIPVAAQESPAPATPAPTASPAPATAGPAVTTPPAAATQAPAATPQTPAATPKPPKSGPKWERATPPDSDPGFVLHDVIAGGPGFIAVGGGRPRRENADPRALIWLSEDGRRWQSTPLFGDAATGVVQAIVETPDGFVAVGNACCPDGAAVWRSADGIVWERVPDAEALAGASMSDVVSGDDGLLAVGCPATLECSGGRVWRSADGTTWEIVADLTIIPFSIAQTADGYVMTGTDSDVGGRGATATSPDGVTWTVTVAERRPGSLNDAEPFGATALVAGGETIGGADRQRGPRRRGVLQTGSGTTWEGVTSGRFKGADFETIGTTDDMVILAGTRLEKGVTVPYSLWSSDLEVFLRGRFPRPNENDGARVNSAAFSADGRIAVAVGATDDDRPVAWFSRPRSRS